MGASGCCAVRVSILGACALAITTLAGQAPSRPLDVESRVEALLAQMTLEEKFGQLQQLSGSKPMPRDGATRSPGLDAQPPGRRNRERAAARGGRRVAPQDSPDLCLRRDPRLSHRVSHPVG